jgi:hypothetical protein
MLWFWLSIPLAAVFFGAWYGIPMWMILTHPDWGPEPAAGHHAHPTGPEPAAALDRSEHPADALALAGTGR